MILRYLGYSSLGLIGAALALLPPLLLAWPLTSGAYRRSDRASRASSD